MSLTTRKPKPKPPAEAPPEPTQERVSFRTTWDGYETIARLIDESDQHEHILIAYDGVTIELTMSPGITHERQGSRLEDLVEVLTRVRAIPLDKLGSTRWARKGKGKKKGKGVESDKSFYLTDAKIAAAADKTDASDCPGPDLSIEVDHRRSRIDRESIYQTLGVPEVWRFDGRRLRIDVLAAEGYVAVDASPALGIATDDVVAWVNRKEPRDTNAWKDAFHDWARARFGP
jgi:Uma2 family endonuclease